MASSMASATQAGSMLAVFRRQILQPSMNTLREPVEDRLLDTRFAHTSRMSSIIKQVKQLVMAFKNGCY
jgi:hypothetical protein